MKPIEEKVAAILRATMPLLPTPLITSLARRLRQASNRMRAAYICCGFSRWAAVSIAAAASWRQRLRAVVISASYPQR